MADETKKLTGAAAAAAARKADKEAGAPDTTPAVTGDGGNVPEEPGAAKKATKRVKPAKPGKAKVAGDKETAGETKKAATKKVETKVKKAADESYEALAARYRKLYPNCKKFHITEDKQVFLENNEANARMHQRSLGGGEVHTIEIE